jgi:hypothetical protein
MRTFRKFRNFHNCRQVFHVRLEPSFYFRDPEMMKVAKEITYGGAKKQFSDLIYNRTDLYDGLIYDLIQTMAKKANFTPHFQLIQASNLIPYNNQSFKDGFTITQGVIMKDESLGYHFTNPFTVVNNIYAITPSESYSNYEKMFFAFDRITWIFLAIVFSATSGIIIIVNNMPKEIQDTVYGKGVMLPSYNTLGAFFGISQVVLPQRTFSRILLITFVMFCFLLRLYYQGMLFDMITMDMKRPLPETLDDLRERGYTVVISKESEMYFEHKAILNGRKG